MTVDPQEIPLDPNAIVGRLISRDSCEGVAILDSCATSHLGSHLMIAGIDPVETLRLGYDDPEMALEVVEANFKRGLAAIFTIAYDFGLCLEPRLAGRRRSDLAEPAIYVSLYDHLLVHDYKTGRTFLTGNRDKFPAATRYLEASRSSAERLGVKTTAVSNFSRESYKAAVERIREFIRRGDTYQANLTQKFRIELPSGRRAGDIFLRLRRDNPSPFAAFIDRGDSVVVSASPERFFRVADGRIETSPIKGTRRRGTSPEEDERLKSELLSSAKDRAENTMIVDLLRNDLGRVCKFGTVVVDALCELEVLPTLFHLVSTISGELDQGIGFGDIIRAIFPCGSITGAPKIRTMEIIDDIENEPRGLSMGAIGYFVPDTGFDLNPGFDLSVAIRTMVVRDSVAEFNVGGGVVSDSDAEAEYEESLLKAKALLAALGADFSG
jgi:para-aminobenzoate synthetase component 1